MNYAKFMISSLIFIALTAIRLSMPSLADSISHEIRNVLITEETQTQSVMELGASLTDGKFFPAFKNDADDIKIIPIIYVLDYESVLPLPKEEPELEEIEETPPKVEAFLKSQEPYSAYEVPENVSYEMPELPFEYISPVAGVSSSGFGYRMHPIQNDVRYHYGTDFAANSGDSVCAFADGTISSIGENDSYGKYMIIDHGNGYSTLYAHCSQLCLSSGSVAKGEVIALVGASGAVTGPHLHFELMHGDTYLNPEYYV